MRTYTALSLSSALAAMLLGAAPAHAGSAEPPAQATTNASAPAPAPASRPGGLTEIPDPQLALMRGRYTVGDNAVAWFGVSMISTWQDAAGQSLQSTLMLGMDFRDGDQPTITFTPTVSITAADAPLPPATASGTRSVDGAGLANVSGLTQSIQVAGDGNLASNRTQLNVRNGDAPPAQGAASAPLVLTTGRGGASASAGFDGTTASVGLQIEGQGAVQQWIRSGSLGQSIQLSADNQQVDNHLQVDLVRQSLAANTQLVQNVAQAIGMTRGVGAGGGR